MRVQPAASYVLAIRSMISLVAQSHPVGSGARLLGTTVEYRSAPGYAPGVLPTFNSCDTAVSTCAGANGLAINTLFGTPNDAQS